MKKTALTENILHYTPLPCYSSGKSHKDMKKLLRLVGRGNLQLLVRRLQSTSTNIF